MRTDTPRGSVLPAALLAAMPLGVAARAADAPKARWHGGVAANLQQVDARAKTRTFSLIANAKRESAGGTSSFEQTFLSARQRAIGEGFRTTEEIWFANGSHTWRAGDWRSGFVNGQLQTDRIQNLRLRAIVGSGVSIFLRRRPRLSARTRLGLAFRGESFRGKGSTNDITGEFGYSIEAHPAPKTRLTHDFTIYPNLAASHDSYFLSQFVLEQTLIGNLYFDLRAILERDTTPAPGASRSVNRFLIGIGARF